MTIPTPTTNPANTPPTPTPTLPGVTNPNPPPAAPNNPPLMVNLDEPYLAYINSVPNLAAALTALGRAWHKELNKPIWDAIDALQSAATSFSTSMLSADFIHGPSILRTTRASSSLEDAKVAWSRLLNIPGKPGKKRRGVGIEASVVERKAPIPTGRFYSHQELWSRGNGVEMELEEGSERAPARKIGRWYMA